jgi:hypothetical protein
MKGNKVLNHPEREEIIKKLVSGDSLKSVEEWLKKKHPRTPRLQISYMTLQKFRKEHLHIEGEVLDKIKQARREQGQESEELEARAIIVASSAYQDKINEIVSNELDANRKLLEMSALIGARMEYYFNSLNQGSNIQQDKMFLDLVNAQRGLVQDWKKFVEGVADKKIEHNINVSVINEQVTVIKSIVFEVLQEMSPELIPVFVEKVNSRLENTRHGTPTYESYQQIEVIDAEYE